VYDDDGERSSSPPCAAEVPREDLSFEADFELLEAELALNPFSSDGMTKENEVEAKVEFPSESTSDDLFDMDLDLQPEDLEALDISSNEQLAQKVSHQSGEDDVLFGDGYDELIDIDLEDTEPEVSAHETN
jgi:hypothetical protein